MEMGQQTMPMTPGMPQQNMNQPTGWGQGGFNPGQGMPMNPGGQGWQQPGGRR